MTASAFKFTPPKRRGTNISRRSSRSYRDTRYRHMIEEQIGILNLLRRCSYPGFIDGMAKNRDEIQKAKLDGNKGNALQFWIILGSIMQIPKGLTEFLDSVAPDIIDEQGAGARVAAFLNVLGLLILLYPTVVVCNWYISSIFCSYKRGFSKLYGQKMSWVNLNSRATWHTVRELSFARSDAMVRPQTGKDWVLEIMHNVDPPLPIRDSTIPASMWKRLQALTDGEYERSLAKPDMNSLFSTGSSTDESYGALSV